MPLPQVNMSIPEPFFDQLTTEMVGSRFVSWDSDAVVVFQNKMIMEQLAQIFLSACSVTEARSQIAKLLAGFVSCCHSAGDFPRTFVDSARIIYNVMCPPDVLLSDGEIEAFLQQLTQVEEARLASSLLGVLHRNPTIGDQVVEEGRSYAQQKRRQRVTMDELEANITTLEKIKVVPIEPAALQRIDAWYYVMDERIKTFFQTQYVELVGKFIDAVQAAFEQLAYRVAVNWTETFTFEGDQCCGNQ